MILQFQFQASSVGHQIHSFMQKHLRLEIVFGLGFGLWALGRERERERERAGVRSFETEKMSLHKNLLERRALALRISI